MEKTCKTMTCMIAVLLSLFTCSSTARNNDNYIKLTLEELTRLQKMDETQFNTEIIKMGFTLSRKDIRDEEGNGVTYYFKKGYNPSIGYNFYIGMAVINQIPLISRSERALRYTFPISELSYYTTTLSTNFEKSETKKYEMPDNNGKSIEVEEVSYKDKANNIWYSFACTDTYCMLIID